MEGPQQESVTRLLIDWRGGNEQALAGLLPLVYDELRRLARLQMRGERSDHTLQATALVHEAFARLVGTSVNWLAVLRRFATPDRVQVGPPRANLSQSNTCSLH